MDIKYKLLILLLVFFQINVPAKDNDNKLKIGVLVNGDACNIDWADKLAQFEIINPSMKNFLVGQFDWELNERLFKHQPDYCLVYGGLPDVLLQLPLADIVNSYSWICNRLNENGISPIIIETLPVKGHSAINARLNLLNHQLRNYAATNNILCFNPGKGLSRDNLLKAAYTQDGFLLNEQGLELFAKNVSEYLDDLILLKKGNIIPQSTANNLLNEGINNIISFRPEKVNIAMLGNSITAGADWNKLLGRNDVLNAGQGGYTSGQMLWHMDTTVISTKPEICFVMAGVNDLFNNIPADVIHQNQKEIIKKLLDNNIKPVMQLTLYVHNNPSLNKRIELLNERLKKYCEANNIDYIDLNTALSDENGLKNKYTTDGTHLTEKAYIIWASELKKYLRKNIESE